ncbi:MAG: aminopeptidase [Owenweeksia sp.]|nr:aminopeptidase [Owenweeksia sp.]MBF99760.1 aminopeptidase [Owenweeksia sp.]HBF18855.1 aminopeptidase [Cryomorphaceae bacterium]
MRALPSFLSLMLLGGTLIAQNTNQSKFKQLYEELPTPNMYRTGGGAPGSFYYQQQADYSMDIRLDDATQRIYGEEVITYTNNSPDPLEYLWIQLDQNMRAPNSMTQKIRNGGVSDKMSYGDLKYLFYDFDGGFKIEYVKDENDQAVPFYINNTMMRINLDKPLANGEQKVLKIKWWYNINDRNKIGGRSGYEYFKDEDNYLYTIAQFFPRMAVYNDVEGWQNKQFLGRGEFALPFGNYDVKITVPADHIVGSTGKLQNADEVLSEEQRDRWEKAQNSTTDPVFIVTESEAKKNEKSKSKQEKTWHFQAGNVRDFAFASSRKFIWDAMAVKLGNRTVMAVSYYPKEGNPLWERYSTRVVAHTLKVYSKYTFDYPYHKAISVHTDRIGMEYPMICFNGGRPEKDGTYSKRTKYGMISVIIHEVGHNFFPMIVNSDERQWTWMDEGLNTFVQYLTEVEWEKDYPSRRGPASLITDYMKAESDQQMPIMTNSESILQFGNNAYGKPATALNILRETVLGRELFDYAFRVYCQRWMFKHPTPADFFRTMEDASGTDLDWFFRGWFFTTDHVDISLDNVRWFKLNTGNPDVENARERKEALAQRKFIGDLRNDTLLEGKRYADQYPAMNDFYNTNDDFVVLSPDREKYEEYQDRLDDEEKELLRKDLNYYELSFTNKGGLVMPVILEFTFTDGSKQLERIPAEIWLRNEYAFNKVFVSQKELQSVELDPYLETADTDRDNNYWPPRQEPSRFELFKEKKKDELNRMQEAQR